jgi:hypothetical protein
MDMKKISLSIIFSLAIIFPMFGQTVSGRVVDGETKQPIEGVMICLVRGQSTVGYTLTNGQGHYSLSWKHAGKLQLTASLLGYRKEIRDVSSASSVNISMTKEPYSLKEVSIRPSRVYKQKDTIRYDLSQYASSKDTYIKDVLKKLPGVDVDENGQVKYQGKAIDHYLVEGMDLTGGRYNQINNNLTAKSVKTAEIMENYQPVKALDGKIASDQVALNLKLDPEARDQWIVNGTLGGGISHGNEDSLLGDGESENSQKGLWEASLSGFQLGKKQQTIYGYKTNNHGLDLTSEQQMMTNANGQTTAPDLKGFLSQTSISAPIDKQRILFNQVHTANANRMYRWNDNQSLRLQAGYTHDQIRQQRQNTQSYFREEGAVEVSESYNYRLRKDAANLELTYEDNSSSYYLTNRFTADGEINKGTSPELKQVIGTSEAKLANYFNLLRNNDKASRTLTSIVRYAYQPAYLSLEGERQNVYQQNLFTDNSASYLKKHNGFTQKYKAGIQGEWAMAKVYSSGAFDASNLRVYFAPYFQFERDNLLASLSVPANFDHYFTLHRSLVFLDPLYSIRYQFDYRWKVAASASWKHSSGELTDLYPSPHQTDYRTWTTNNRLFPRNNRQNYSLYAEYKNTLQEFFATASVSYSRVKANTLFEQSVSENVIVYSLKEYANCTNTKSINLNLSKGVFDWHLKASLEIQASLNQGIQLTKSASNGESTAQNYRYDNLLAQPKLIWSPQNLFEAEYNASISYGRSKIGSGIHLTPLLNVTHRLNLSFGITQNVDLRISGEYYRNQLAENATTNNFFADASLVFKKGKWRAEASLTNLFDKKEYAYTSYSANQSYTSHLGIRPREAMAKLSYQF